MPKIVVTQDLNLSQEQIKRLENLGELTLYNQIASSHEELIQRCLDADIVCARKTDLESVYSYLSNVFISAPFVEVGWANRELLKARHITIANAPGCNKEAVSEWVIGMLINMFRKLPESINANYTPTQQHTLSLAERKVCILGVGNIGSRVGQMCNALGMNLVFFKRGDNLISKTNSVDVVINCLNRNESTEKLLNQEFFSKLKTGAYFISIADPHTFEPQALFNIIDAKQLGGVALDASVVSVYGKDFYAKCKDHPKIYITSTIAARTDITARNANDIMISNIEAWLQGKAQNIIG